MVQGAAPDADARIGHRRIEHEDVTLAGRGAIPVDHDGTASREQGRELGARVPGYRVRNRGLAGHRGARERDQAVSWVRFGEQPLEEAVAVLQALADANRLRILDLLMQGDSCNCELKERLDLPPNLLSHHLRVLRQAGLVRSRSMLCQKTCVGILTTIFMGVPRRGRAADAAGVREYIGDGNFGGVYQMGDV